MPNCDEYGNQTYIFSLFYNPERADEDCDVSDFVDRMKDFGFENIEDVGENAFVGEVVLDGYQAAGFYESLKKEITFGVAGFDGYENIDG